MTIAIEPLLWWEVLLAAAIFSPLAVILYSYWKDHPR